MKIKNIENIQILCIIALLVLASFVYFYRLGMESLLTDEYLSLHVAQQPLERIIFQHNENWNPNAIPPLYEILLHFWLKLFGTGEFAQRSLSALFGVCSAYILYLLAKLLFDSWTGIIAMLFGVLSYSWFSFFRQNRCYGLFILLVLLSFYLFFYYLKNKNNRFSYYAFIIINIALLYTHYLSFFIILLQLIFAALLWKRNEKFFFDILFMGLCAGVTFAPWYRNFLHDYNREPVIVYRRLFINLPRNIIDFLKLLFYDFHFRWEPVLTLIYLPFIVRGCKRLRKMQPGEFRFGLFFLLSIYLVPLILIYSFTRSARIRFYCAFYFPLYILLALGIRDLKIKGFRAWLYCCIFITAAFFNFNDFYDFLRGPLNENWKQAAKCIKKIPGYQNKNMIFLFQTRYNAPVFAYYFWDNKLSRFFADNITSYVDYEKDLISLKIKHKIYITGSTGIPGKTFFEKISAFPEDAWIWVFRYQNLLFERNIKLQNKGRYFIRKTTLNKEIPQIDMYFIKKIR
jgi:hypothetical protein